MLESCDGNRWIGCVEVPDYALCLSYSGKLARFKGEKDLYIWFTEGEVREIVIVFAVSEDEVYRLEKYASRGEISQLMFFCARLVAG